METSKVRVSFVVALALISQFVAAADHAWQSGTLREVRVGSTDGGAVSIPIGGTPPTTVAGVTIAGTAPMYLSFPMTAETEFFTIDGPSGMRYVARSNRHLKGFVINDPIDFTVERDNVFVRGPKPSQSTRLWLVSTTRLEKSETVEK